MIATFPSPSKEPGTQQGTWNRAFPKLLNPDILSPDASSFRTKLSAPFLSIDGLSAQNRKTLCLLLLHCLVRVAVEY